MPKHSELAKSFLGAVQHQPSPKAKMINLGDHLPPDAADAVDQTVRSLPPVQINNPHIWQAASQNMNAVDLHYTARLMGLLTFEHDEKNRKIEDIFDNCNTRALPHFSMSATRCETIIDTVVIPCFRFSRHIKQALQA
jgi:hypothetical protein